MMCPKCSTETLNAFGEVEGVHVDFCSGCKGIWFDEGELAFYTEMPVDVPNMEAATHRGRTTDMLCPRCSGAHLIEIPYMGQERPLLDVCPGCRGVFVDKGELPMIEKLTTKVRGAEVLGHVTKQLEAKGYVILGAEGRQTKV